MDAEIYQISDRIKIYNDDAINWYGKWKPPVLIVSDGPYGVGGFEGDLFSYNNLAEWYEPHIAEWSKYSSYNTSLWFWNTEIGWATVHKVLDEYDWQFVNAHIWNKGKSHIAGNVNTKTIRRLPVVTEICVQYARKPLINYGGQKVHLKEWLRSEWLRSGLKLNLVNKACGVKNAATRKYLTQCRLWYFPPVDAFVKLVEYANSNGLSGGRPYFSFDGKKPVSAEEWAKMRPKFECPFGMTNVWDEPPLNGHERLKDKFKSVHLNQKPLKFMRLILDISTDENDVVWEPFGGLCSATYQSLLQKRIAYAAEIDNDIFNTTKERFRKYLSGIKQ